MKRTICFVLAAILLFCGCGSSGQKTAAEPEQSEEMVETEEVTIFPKSDCFIGDTMPYFENGYMNVFYLADLRDGKTGYHPWALMRTKDYCIYEDMGIVIPYAEDAAEQDIALGTGCVIKDKDGLYHAFYTGHNDHYAPKEAIIHDSSGYQLSGNGYELVQFDALESDARIEAEVTAIGQQDFFGIGFAPDTENVSALNYVFNIKENRVEFYNSEDIQDMEPESCMNYEFTGKDSLHLTILLGGGVASLFVDDELTLTARMYRSQGTAWQLFGVDSTVKWENVAAYR